MAQDLVTNFRKLSDAEIELINKIGAVGDQLEELVTSVDKYIAEQWKRTGAIENDNDAVNETLRLESALPHRWVDHARFDLSSGLMKLKRAVTQPSTF